MAEEKRQLLVGVPMTDEEFRKALKKVMEENREALEILAKY